MDSQAPLAAPAELRAAVSPILVPREKPAAPAKTERGVKSQEHRGCLLRNRALGTASQGFLLDSENPEFDAIQTSEEFKGCFGSRASPGYKPVFPAMQMKPSSTLTD